MMLADTNVLIYGHRPESERHAEYRAWVTELANGPASYAVSDFALCGLLRIVTDKRIYKDPTPIDRALEYVEVIRHRPHAQVISPGRRFWAIFEDLCRKAEVAGKLLPDAYLAALAIEHGCELITTDRDFARFPGLRWRHPLA
jgi:toxin-antitoxin system PIN domain toxin